MNEHKMDTKLGSSEVYRHQQPIDEAVPEHILGKLHEVQAYRFRF